MDIELLAVLLNVGFNGVSTRFRWRTRWCDAQADSLPVTLAQPCSLKAVAEAVAHPGPLPKGLDGPGAFSELRVARGYTDTPVHLAPLDVALTRWWVPVSLAR